MKQLPIPVLKACPCVGVSPCSLHVPSGFGGRAGPEVSTNHVFTWGALAAATLAGHGAGVGRVRTGARCELGLLPGLEQAQSQRGWSCKSELVPLLPSVMAVSTLVRGRAGARGAGAANVS